MAPEEVRGQVINRLKGQKRTLSEISAEVKVGAKVLKDMIKALVSEGVIAKVGDEYFIPDDSGSRSELSETEWKVIRYIQSMKSKQSHLDEVAKSLGMDAANAAIKKLVDVGILEVKGSWYRITSASAMRIPLSNEERMSLQASEDRIDELVGEIHPKQLEVAAELRKIRDSKLYRETHKRFQDYVEERFERTRDWAYKLIRDLEVGEALLGDKSMPNVEAILQTVTTREIPHLSKLMKDPKKMQMALRTADEKAKGESRFRNTDDTKEAVEALLASAKPKKEEPPKPTQKIRKVELEGIDYQGGTTDDVAMFLTDFAKWFRKHPTDSEFSISFGKAA